MPAGDLASLKIHDSARSRGSTGKVLGYFAAAIGVLLLIGGAVFALKNRAPVVEVTTARAAGDPAQQTLLNASGYVTPRRRATVAAKITGRVTGVFFDEGNHAKQGQLLATLDDSDARRTLDSAVADRDSSKAAIRDYEVQLRYAEIQLHRAEELTAAKVQSQDQLDNAMTAADSLRAKIALAKQQVAGSEARIREAQQAVDNCTIRAPFAGIIVSKDAQVGEMVSPISAGGGFTRTGIATIVDMNSNEVEVDVNEAYIARVQPGQRVDSVLDAYPDWKIPSHVRTVIPTADRQKATVKVRISFDKLDPRILPDMGVKVSFYGEDDEKKVATKKKDEGAKALAIVPKSAVRSSGDGTYVFLLKNGKLERRGVKLGNERGSDVEVMAGVNPGDSLVTGGPQNLQDGETVRVNQ
jgi:RND family efflux transporter MFP subunit